MVNADEQAVYWDKPRQRKHPSDPVIAAFVRPKLAYVRSRMVLPASPRILDVGCGNGYFTYYLQEWGSTIGLDYSSAMLSLNPADLRVRGSAFALPFADHSFDLVLEANLLHHLPAPAQAIREMRRVARSYVVLIEPNRNNPLMFFLGLLKPEERALLRFTLAFLKDSARQAGLDILAADTMGVITPNRMPRRLAQAVSGLNAPQVLGAYAVLLAGCEHAP